MTGKRKMDNKTQEEESIKKEWQTPELTRLDLAQTESGGNIPVEGMSGVGDFS